MIASVTSVVRSGADLPTSVRASVPSSAGSTTTTRTTTTPGASASAAPSDTAAAAVEQAEQGQKATGEHADRPAQHADSPADVAATSRYVGELMAARITGASVPGDAKPAHIAPERMATLISFLEENSEPAVSAKADTGKQGVDVKS